MGVLEGFAYLFAGALCMFGIWSLGYQRGYDDGQFRGTQMTVDVLFQKGYLSTADMRRLILSTKKSLDAPETPGL